MAVCLHRASDGALDCAVIAAVKLCVIGAPLPGFGP
jgi:hypothetical protein